jgi:hypothetical protein
MWKPWKATALGAKEELYKNLWQRLARGFFVLFL